MALVKTQLAEIWVAATSSRGTGYLLCSGCLLTAYHVVKDCPETGVIFRLLGDFPTHSDRWLPSSHIWTNEKFDIALVFFDRATPHYYVDREVAIPPIARLDPDQAISCHSCGFPAFRATNGQYEDYPLQGQLKLLNSIKNPALAEFQIQGKVPSTGMKAWQGFSGSPVFTDNGLLAGIVTQGFEEFRGEVIEVLSIGWLLDHDPAGSALMEAVIAGCGTQIICRSLTTAEIAELPPDQQLIPSTAFPRPESRTDTSITRDQVTRSIPPELADLNCQEDPGTVYLVFAVFWRERTPPVFRVSSYIHYLDTENNKIKTIPPLKEEIPVAQSQFPQFLTKYINAVLPKLPTLFPDPLMPWKLTIALFVPVDLLSNPLSDWCGEQSTILQDRVLVLGCSDRFDPDNSDAADLHNALKRGWQKFQGCCPDAQGFSLSVLDWLDSRDPKAGDLNWDRYAGVQCYGDWLKPGPDYESNWQRLVKAGIPLALWMSECQLDIPTIENCFSHLIRGNRFQFLDHIRGVRQVQRNVGSAAGCVGVLYEDPRYLPPVPPAKEEELFAWPSA
jgi:hypothetical protein